EVRTERRGFRPQRGGSGRERGQRLVGRAVVQEVSARNERRQSKAGIVEGHARDAERRLAGIVEHQLQRVAVQQVDAVEGRVLRRGVDLRQHVVVLRHQGYTRGLRVRVGDRRPRQCHAEESTTGRRGRTADRADRRGSRVVRGDDVDLAGRGVDRGLQVVGRQLRIEIVQGRNLTGAQTEGDAGCRAATRRGNGQRLARETVTDRSEAELGQRRTGQGQAGRAARDGDRATRDRRRDAGRSVDRREQVSDVVTDADAGARARGAGNEGEGGAVDDQRVGGGDRGGEVVGRRRAGTGQDRRGGDCGGGAGVVVVDDGAGRRGGRVQEVARGRAGESSRGHVRLRRIAG